MVQEPEALVYHRLGHSIDDPFAIAAYEGTTQPLFSDLVTCLVATIVDGNMRDLLDYATIL